MFERFRNLWPTVHGAKPSSESGDTRSERGFALPLSLAVLVLLSYLSAFTAQKIYTAQIQTRLAAAEVELSTKSLTIESDVLWRAVLEGAGQNLSATATREDRSFRARPPSPDSVWRSDGVPFLWRGTYADLPLPGSDDQIALVMAQDTLGLFDLNTRDANFLAFVANQFGVPRGRIPSAVKALTDYTDSRRPAPSREDLLLLFPNRSGLIDAVEICVLPIWERTELCKSPESVRQIATGGYGQTVNIRFAPPELRRAMIGRDMPDDLEALEQAWVEVQKTYGFYDGLLGVSNGGIRVEVTILIKGYDLATRFEVDLREQEGEQPFSVRNIRVLPAQTVLELARARDPSVVTAFEQLQVMPESR